MKILYMKTIEAKM